MTERRNTPHRRFPLPFLSLMLTGLLILSCAGCMHKAEPTEKNIPEEELYIDAKLGFTVIHPLLWERIKFPVSSPNFRQDSVVWKIPVENGTGRMLIRAYPILTSTDELPNLLKKLLEGKPEHLDGETESFIHSAGETVAITVAYQKHRERVYAIQGSQNSYVLSFYVTNEIYDELFPLFERIAESFREL